jgi:lysophospholipase L1-like esterase
LDNLSFTLNHRQPARFVIIGASMTEGYNASTFARGYVRLLGSNFNEAVANISSSYNSTSNAVSLLPEILAYRPDTAILMIGGNDLLFGYPASQWQAQYATLTAQLRVAGVKVKHGLPPPRSTTDLTALRNWIVATYSPADVIDNWTPLLSGAHSLNPAYDSGDGVHPNDAGHLLLGQIVLSNLPPGIRSQPLGQHVPIGADVGFTVTATGAGTLNYQWQLDGVALTEGGRLTGCATNVLALRNAQMNDSGVYQVVVANIAGAVTSSPARLKVVAPPVIGSATTANGSALLTWSSISGQTFTVQYQDDLHSPNWSNLASVTTFDTASNTSLVVPLGNSSQRFFRVSLAP